MYVYVKHHKEKQMCKSLTVKHTKNTNSHVFEFVTRWDRCITVQPQEKGKKSKYEILNTLWALIH